MKVKIFKDTTEIKKMGKYSSIIFFVFISIFVSVPVFVSSEVFSAPIIVQFKNIQDFDESRFFDFSFYPEIEFENIKTIFGEFYAFCIKPRSSCWYDDSTRTYPEFTVMQNDFLHPVRVLITEALIEETIRRYAGKIELKIPTHAVKEILPELFEELKTTTIEEDTLFSVELISVRVSAGESEIFKGGCWEEFPHIAVADMKLYITAFWGKDTFLDVHFKVPITIDALSWLPDVREIEGERSLKRTTLHILFSTCYSEVKPYLVVEKFRTIIENIKNRKSTQLEKDDFERRLIELISYLIYRYLGTLDFNPISFPILVIPVVDIKKAYIVDILSVHPIYGDTVMKAVALEFDDKGTLILPDEPVILLHKSPNHVINQNMVEIRVKGDELTKKASISLDGGAWMGWKEKDEDGFFTFRIKNLLQGQREVFIIGQNVYGNVNKSPLRFSLLVDRIPPKVLVDLPKYSNKLVVRAKGEDNSGGKILLKIIVRDELGRELAQIDKTFLDETEIAEDIPEGKYTTYIQAKDEAGNTTGFLPRTILIDKQPPTIVPVFIPPPKSNYDSLKIVVRINDNFFPRGYIEYSIEEIVSGGGKTCFSQEANRGAQEIFVPYGEVKLQGLENERSYHLCFRAKDPAGNTGQIFETEFFVDLIPPVIKFENFPSRITFDDNADIIFYLRDNVSQPDNINLYWTFSNPSKIKNIFAKGGMWRVSISDLEDGKYKFSAYATDEAGNISQIMEREFIVDTTLLKVGGGKGLKLGCSSYALGNLMTSLMFLIFYFLFTMRIIRTSMPAPRTPKGR